MRWVGISLTRKSHPLFHDIECAYNIENSKIKIKRPKLTKAGQTSTKTKNPNSGSANGWRKRAIAIPSSSPPNIP